jgi:4,5-dihydroxyphthalate decarboxylase
MPKSEYPALSIAVSRTDRTWPIVAGDVPLAGYDLDILDVRLEEIFVRQLSEIAFDIAETSLASYLIALGRGETRLTAVPVFLSRSFRHNAFFVRADSALERIEDLRGVRIGVPEYQMTAAVWIRALMREHGIENGDNTWVTFRPERVPIATPAEQSPHPDIHAALRNGEIDVAFIVRRPPDADLGRDGSPGALRRLLRDPWQAEREYFSRTHTFPIMHLVTLRRSLADADPALPAAVYEMFVDAKTRADVDLHETTYLAAAQPWLIEGLEAAHHTIGADLWPYGARANWPLIEGFIHQLRADGLLDRDLTIADVFAAPLIDSER